MVVTIKKKTIKTAIIDISVLLPFISFPDYVLHGGIGTIFNAYKITIFVSLFIALLIGKLGKIDKMHIITAAAFSIPLVATIITGEPKLITALSVLIGNIGLLSYMKKRLEDDSASFLRNAIILWAPIVLFNTLTFFLFYRNKFAGINDSYFLGNDNGTIFDSLLLIAFMFVYCYIRNKKISKWAIAILVIILAGYLRTASGNATIGCLLAIALAVLYKKHLFEKVFKPFRMALIYIAAFIIIVFGSSNYYISQALGTFGKNTTYTGRTIIWERMGKKIAKKPITGNGYETNSTERSSFGHIKAHNMAIQIMYDGGIAELSFIALAIMFSFQSIKRREDDERLKGLLLGIMIIYLTVALFDYYNYKFHFMSLISLVTYLKSSKSEKVALREEGGR